MPYSSRFVKPVGEVGWGNTKMLCAIGSYVVYFLEQNSQTFGGREIVVQDKKVLFLRNTI